jgi:hypothetical protein
MWYAHAIKGVPQRRLAEQYGISYGRVSQIIAEQRKLQPEQTRQERADDLVARLEEDMATARAQWLAAAPSSEAYGPTSRTYIRLMERYARLLGLDAPTKLEHSAAEPMTYVIEGDDTIVEALK